MVRVVDDGATNSTTGSESVQIKNAEDFNTKLESGTLAQGFMHVTLEHTETTFLLKHMMVLQVLMLGHTLVRLM